MASEPAQAKTLSLGDPGGLGNSEGAAEGKLIEYVLPERRSEGLVYAEGPWRAFADRLVFSGRGGGAVYVGYSAEAVEVMMAAEAKAVVWINQDRRKTGREVLGADGRIDEKGRAFVRVTGPRRYRLIRNQGVGRHELRLFTQARGLALYAFTFVSGTGSPQ